MSSDSIRRYARHQFNAYLGYYNSFWGYLRTYQNAFEALLNNTHDTNLHVDNLSFPMLFIARHCMELGFKANIRHFQKYSEREDYKKANTHDLEKLFEAFKLHVKSTIKNLDNKYGIQVDEDDVRSFEEYCSEVEKLTQIFHQLDHSSDSFRYPVNKSNNRSFEHTETINLLDVKELFDKSMLLLNHTSDVFSKYIDYATEIEKMYQDEMKSLYDQDY